MKKTDINVKMPTQISGTSCSRAWRVRDPQRVAVTGNRLSLEGNM